MNSTILRIGAVAAVLSPIALMAHAQDPTPVPVATSQPTKTPKPTKTPRPTRVPRATATPRPTPTSTSAPIPVSATDGDDGRTLFVSRGGIIELRLASNPSTGYKWTVVSNKNLKLEGEPSYEATAAAPDIVGSGGFTVFRFRGEKKGTGDLALDLRAPAYKDGDEASKTFRAIVKVLK